MYVMHVCDSCNVIMCSVACMNYCQFHRSLYGSSNSVLFVLNSLEMHTNWYQSQGSSTEPGWAG
jgi:hypothetical protein